MWLSKINPQINPFNVVISSLMFYLIADEEDLVKEFFGASRDEVFVIDEVDDSEIDFNGMLNFGGTLDKIIEMENGFSTSSDKEIDWRTHILAKFFKVD